MEAKKKIVFIKDLILNYLNSMPKKAKSLVVGVPVKIIREITDEEYEMIITRPQEYIDLASKYKKNNK